MKSLSVTAELREMLPAFAFWVLLPLPLATFWNVGPGRDFALLYLFIGAALVTAERISTPLQQLTSSLTDEIAKRVWRTKMSALLIAAIAAVTVFTFFGCCVIGSFDSSIPLFASLAILPAIMCVPFLTFRTGGVYSAIVILFLLLGSIKILSCIVVRAVYGPFALKEGFMNLPWTHPNLLVWLCLIGAFMLSTTFFQLGRQCFIRQGFKESA